jgi:hypothetical protein
MALYAQITNLSAPSQAAAGDRVDVIIDIKNIGSVPITMLADCVVDAGSTPWESIVFDTEKTLTLNPGTVGEFRGHFSMPNSTVTIHALSSYYGTDYGYHFDDEKTKSVAINNAWLLVATKTISVSYDVALSGGWLLVATKTISISYGVPITGEWLLVATRSISVEYSGNVISGDWLLVSQKILEINKPDNGGEDSGQIPWAWIIGGIGGAVAVGGILLLAQDNKAAKSPQKALRKKIA